MLALHSLILFMAPATSRGEAFELLDDDTGKAMKPAREALGIKDEVLKRYSDEFIARVERGEQSK